jgi:signal transduction histidine kinase
VDSLLHINSIPEPTLILSAEGMVLAANTGFADLTRIRNASGRSLNDLVESANLAENIIKSCLRSTGAVPGAVSIRTTSGPLPCRFIGARVDGGEPVRVWMRFIPIDQANSRFVLLNERIDKLAKEVAARRRAESLLRTQRDALELVALNAPLATILDSLVRAAEKQSPDGMVASILLLDDDGIHLRHGAARSLPPDYIKAIDGVSIGPSAGSCGTAAFTARTVITSDIETDPRWENYREFARAANLRACWSTPIFSRNGKVLGTFAMYYHKPRSPRPVDLEILEFLRNTAALAIERDVNERLQRLSEQALLKSEKLATTGRMASTIAHEINTPLMAVNNLLYLVRKDASLTETARSYLSSAEAELARVGRIARQVLGFSKGDCDATAVDLGLLIEDVLLLYYPRIAHKNIKVEKRVDASTSIMGFSGDLRQLFSNLIANAIDAMDMDGTLYLEGSPQTSTRGPGVLVRVRDTGKGIAPEHRLRIFEPFFTTKSESGNGLGLWVVKNVVDKHGGIITVESTTSGPFRGTSFSVFLPSRAHAEESAHVATVSQPSGR